jgi:hypothetical protein
MTHSNVSHVGFLVPDLLEGMARISRALGISFLPPLDQEIAVLEEGGQSAPGHIRLTWSIEGPPHIELIEGQVSGLYAYHGIDRAFHHLGGFTESHDESLSHFSSLGIRMEACQREPDGTIIASYSEPHDLFGIRYEHIAPGRRADIEKWLSGEPWS